MRYKSVSIFLAHINDVTLWINNLIWIPSNPPPIDLSDRWAIACIWINDSSALIRWKSACRGQGNDCPFPQVICLMFPYYDHNGDAVPGAWHTDTLGYHMKYSYTHFPSRAWFLLIIFHCRSLVIITDLSIAFTISPTPAANNPLSSSIGINMSLRKYCLFVFSPIFLAYDLCLFIHRIANHKASLTSRDSNSQS